MESWEVKIMRNMEWQRVKGQLHAILSTFYGTKQGDDRYENASKAVKKFIDEVDGEGLFE